MSIKITGTHQDNNTLLDGIPPGILFTHGKQVYIRATGGKSLNLLDFCVSFDEELCDRPVHILGTLTEVVHNGIYQGIL